MVETHSNCVIYGCKTAFLEARKGGIIFLNNRYLQRSLYHIFNKAILIITVAGPDNI